MAVDKHSVSVIIPAYNAGKYIGQALDSVLTQQRPAKEIIVVNDCSTDDTLDVLKVYTQAHPDFIKVLSTRTNSGVSAARNMGIQAANGELIALLDGDDYWKDCHLAILVELLERYPEADWAFSEMVNLFPDGTLGKHTCGGSIPDNVPFDCFFQFAWFCRAQTSTVVIKKTVFDKAGYFTPEYRQAEDYDLFMRISKDHPVIHSPEVTTFWRKHITSLTAANPKKYNVQTISIRHAYLEKHKGEMTPQQVLELGRITERSWRDEMSQAFYSNDHEIFSDFMECRKYLPNPKIAIPWKIVRGVQPLRNVLHRSRGLRRALRGTRNTIGSLRRS